MPDCPNADCGASIEDAELNFCPECMEPLASSADLPEKPVQGAPLGPDVLGKLPSGAAGRVEGRSLQSGGASSVDAGQLPVIGESIALPVTGVAAGLRIPAAIEGAGLAGGGGPALARAVDGPSAGAGAGLWPAEGSGAGWIRGSPVASEAGQEAKDRPEASRPFSGYRVGVSLRGTGAFGPDARESAELGTGYRRHPGEQELGEIGERVVLLIDHVPDLQVGAAGSIFVRLQRRPTPRRLDVILHWELEVDGLRRTESTEEIWHADDWDQDCMLGVTPTRSGQVRLVRLSLAIIPEGDARKVQLLTVQDIPIAFQVREATGTQPIVQNIQVQGTGNAISNRLDAQSSVQASRRQPEQDLKAKRLVQDPRREWWSVRKHVLAVSHAQRALLSWTGRDGAVRSLMMCARPQRFCLGRQRDTNDFVLRWSPCRDGLDHEHRELSQTISRKHFELDIVPSAAHFVRLAKATYVPKLPSTPVFGRADGESEGSVLEALSAESMMIQRSLTIHIGGRSGLGLDGLQLRLRPVDNPHICGVLIERLNNRCDLAYLAMVGAVPLGTAGFFAGLPRELHLESKNGRIELRGPAATDLSSINVTLRECYADEFID